MGMHKQYTKLSPEQEKQFAVLLETWDTDWGPLTGSLSSARGIPRGEAMLCLLAMQMASVRDALMRSEHPKFNPACPHCIEQKARDERTAEYMRKIIRYMDEEDHGEDWKPPI